MFLVAGKPHPLTKIFVCVSVCILISIVVVVRLDDMMYILWTLLERLEHDKL